MGSPRRFWMKIHGEGQLDCSATPWKVNIRVKSRKINKNRGKILLSKTMQIKITCRSTSVLSTTAVRLSSQATVTRALPPPYEKPPPAPALHKLRLSNATIRTQLHSQEAVNANAQPTRKKAHKQDSQHRFPELH